MAEVLIKGGWDTIEKIASASVEQLTSLQGVGDKTAERLISAAKEVLESKDSAVVAQEVPSYEQKSETPE